MRTRALLKAKEYLTNSFSNLTDDELDQLSFLIHVELRERNIGCSPAEMQSTYDVGIE